MLRKIREKIKDGGRIVIEVPHANDFLLSTLKLESFKKFTLWSQHLVLHTRHSLELTLKEAGFKDVLIEGVQRYNLSNHLSWISQDRPGGHKSDLSIIESKDLNLAYANSLSKIDKTDTLVAIARV